MAHAFAVPALPRSRRADDSWHGLDGPRIAANAGALTLNAVALLLLLAPVTLPPPAALADRDPKITWVRPKIEPTPIPIPVPVTTRPELRPRPQPAAAQPRVAPADSAGPSDDNIAADEAEAATDTVTDADAGDAVDIARPIAESTRLQAVAAPSPRYPPDAIRGGLSGTVELEILVGVDGKPLEVRVVRSSGHRVLDQAARKVVLAQWRFQPAMRDGLPVQALGRVPIAFTLER